MTQVMRWNELEATGQVSVEDNEIHVEITGNGTADDHLLEQFQENGVEVTDIELQLQGEPVEERQATDAASGGWIGGAITPQSRQD